MKAEIVTKLAKLIVEHSTKVEKGERVVITGPPHTTGLLEEIYRFSLARGAFPEVKVFLPTLTEILLKEGEDEQIRHLPETRIREAEETDVHIGIISETNLNDLANVDPAKLTLLLDKSRRLKRIKYEKESRGEMRWCAALWPTEAYAQLAEMSLSEFFDFFTNACYLDRPDPIEGLEEIHRFNDLLEERLRKTDEIRVLSEDTDLKLRIKGRSFHNCYGQVNMPDGEVATAPIEDATEGRVHFSYPFISEGKEINDISLTFEEGKVIEARARTNEDFLRKMIAVDEGAGRFGEIGFGTNYRIPRFTKNILFDEKIGGTIHLALGNSYDVEGGKNKSTIHWDLILDLRKGGRVYTDGTLLIENEEYHL